MYKIMVVDDEYIVIESISHIVERNFTDAKVVSSAESGTEFLEKVYENAPDIIFMDIEMPDMSGLQVISKLGETISARFIILTAYDYFTYSQKALQLGVVDYLLKPFCEEEIIATLRNTITGLEKIRNQNQIDQNTRKKLSDSLGLIEKELIDKIVSFNPNQQKSMQALLSTIGISMRSCFAILIEFQQIQNDSVIDKIRSSIFTNSLSAIFGKIGKKKICIIAQLPENKDEANRKLYRSVKAQELFSNISKVVHGNLVMSIGEIGEGFHGAHQSYMKAEIGIQVNPDASGFVDASLLSNDYNAKGLVFEEDELKNLYLEKILHNKLKNNQSEEALGILYIIYNNICITYKDIPERIKSKMIELAVGIFRMAQRDGIPLHAIKLNYSRYFDEYLELSIDELITRLVLSITYICEHYTIEQDHNLDVLQRAKEHLTESFTKKVSIEDLAKTLHVTQGWLSKKFKEVYGETCGEFLTRMRIERGMDQLHRTTKTIKEISYQVGYDDPNYFCRVFKKHTGYKPSTFRKQRNNR